MIPAGSTHFLSLETTVKHILITGATGFVGINLIRYLHGNFPKVKITQLARNKAQQTDRILWDELNLEHLTDIDAIIHLAGKAHDTKNASNPQEYFTINFGLTKKLYDLFLQSGCRKFIFMSSVKAAADTVQGKLTEEITPAPHTPYGLSKFEAEEYIIQHATKHSTFDSQQYYILRPCMIHGAGNKGNLNLLYQFASKGIPYPLAAFYNKRSFLSIDNLLFVIRALLVQDVASGIYNVADDETLSTNELVKTMAAIQSKTAKLWKAPKKIVKAMAVAGDLLKLPLNTERLKKLTESYQVSNKKIKQAIGISEMPVTAKQGLEKTIRSFS